MRAGPAVFLLLATLACACSCGGRQNASPAADEVIATAENDEERAGLTQARDDIDSEMRRVAAEKDAEIERLRKENEALRKKLRR
jgi:hypothetical protein